MQNNSRFAVAIHILTVLAYKREEPITSDCIAQSVLTNPVVIRRTLGDLRRAGLAQSQPGNGGGWRLTREPERITLLDAYHAVQKRNALALPPQEPNPHCEIGKTMCGVLREFFDEAEDAMKEYLRERTLAEVLERVQTKRRRTPYATEMLNATCAKIEA